MPTDDDQDERHPLVKRFDAEHRHHGPARWHEWLVAALHVAIIGAGLFILLDR